MIVKSGGGCYGNIYRGSFNWELGIESVSVWD